MRSKFLKFTLAFRFWFYAIATILSFGFPETMKGQDILIGNETIEELIGMGFENVRCAENENERIYTIENNVYKAQGVGIAKAIEIIQRQGLPSGKRCKVIVTHLEVPEMSLTYHPSNSNDSLSTNGNIGWETSYDVDGWKEVRKEKAKNSSRYKVYILVYPQLSYKNLINTQIYQALFT